MRRAWMVGVVAVAALTGCSTAAPPASVPAASASQQGQVAARHGLQGLDAKAIVDRLDRTNAERSTSLTGSVRGYELVLADDSGEETLRLPDGRFYLSVAPFVSQTHDCFNHNLATCQGELAGKAMSVRIVDDAGKQLADQDVTSYENGFVGFWLPRDVTGTVEVTYDGKTGRAPFSTAADSASCMTTLQVA